MKIAVFGATGRTGRHIVDQALEEGHTITALARYPERMHREHKQLNVIRGHVQEQRNVSDAIEGQDAVISVLGQVRERPSITTLLTVSAGNITEAMHEHGVRRLIFLLGAGVSDPGDQPSFGSRVIVPLMRLVAGHVLKDAEDAAEIIRESELDWTIVRVPRLGDEPPRNDLTVGYHKPGFAPISRADVATFMLNQIERDEYRQKAPIISY